MAAVLVMALRWEPGAATTAALLGSARDPQCAPGATPLQWKSWADSGWRLCWTIDPSTGLLLTQVRFDTADRRQELMVLKSASMAQINVPYDDGGAEHWDLPGYGVLTAEQSPRDCAKGTLLAPVNGHSRVCAITTSEAYRYAWSDYDFGTGNHLAAGQCLTLNTLTPADWYSYLNRWSFCDDGAMRVEIGAGGTLAPRIYGDPTDSSAVGPGSTRLAMAHYHNYFWRLEFAYKGDGDVAIDQVDVLNAGSRRPHTVRPLETESAAKSAGSRFWVVRSKSLRNRDGRPVGYDLLMSNPDPYRGSPGHGYTNNDLYLTQYRPCELLAARNDQKGCAASVDGFVDGEPLHRPVVWVQESFHHLPRDEDEPIMNEHWSGFAIRPRGVTANNPLVVKNDR